MVVLMILLHTFICLLILAGQRISYHFLRFVGRHKHAQHFGQYGYCLNDQKHGQSHRYRRSLQVIVIARIIFITIQSRRFGRYKKTSSVKDAEFQKLTNENERKFQNG
uniref:Secreted protein n=1 Tax=Romanomermis culicivorax TaxID=13658 RepID=A0A915IKQ6_ROMCU